MGDSQLCSLSPTSCFPSLLCTHCLLASQPLSVMLCPGRWCCALAGGLQLWRGELQSARAGQRPWAPKERVSGGQELASPDGRCQPGLSLSLSGMALPVGVGCHSSTSPFLHPAAAILCPLGGWLWGYRNQMWGLTLTHPYLCQWGHGQGGASALRFVLHDTGHGCSSVKRRQRM